MSLAGERVLVAIGRVFLIILGLLTIAPIAARAQSTVFPQALSNAADDYLDELQRRPPQSEDTVDKALSSIAAAESDGHTGAAIAAYEELAALEPKSYRAWLQLAAAWRKVTPDSEKAVAAAVQAARVAGHDFEQFEALLMVAGVLREQLHRAQLDFERSRQRILTIEETARVWKIPIGPDSSTGEPSPLYGDFSKAHAEALQESVTAAAQISTVTGQLDEIYNAVFVVVKDQDAFARVQAEIAPSPFQIAVRAENGASGGEGEGEGEGEGADAGTPNYDVVAETLDGYSRACIRFTLPISLDVDKVKSRLTLRDADTNQRIAIESIQIDDDRLCVLALEPEHNYLLSVADGLMSQTGVALAEAVEDIPIAIPARAELVGFRGSAFILPREGDGEVPLYSVNAASVSLHLLRITDRNLHRHVALGEIGSRLPAKEYREMRELFSDPIWDGSIPIEGERNKLVTSQIPVLKILEDRKAWLAEEPVPADLSGLPHVSSDRSVGPVKGRYTADRVSYQAARDFDVGAGTLCAGHRERRFPPTDDGEEHVEDFCEAYLRRQLRRAVDRANRHRPGLLRNARESPCRGAFARLRQGDAGRGHPARCGEQSRACREEYRPDGVATLPPPADGRHARQSARRGHRACQRRLQLHRFRRGSARPVAPRRLRPQPNRESRTSSSIPTAASTARTTASI